MSINFSTETSDVPEEDDLCETMSEYDASDDENLMLSLSDMSLDVEEEEEEEEDRDSRRNLRTTRSLRSRVERRVDRKWDLRRCSSGIDPRRQGGDLECRLMVRPRGREGRISMDMDEVKACRDLGLSLPRDWTVEISGGSPPISDWCISSPEDDPMDMKAKLKVWAQAVALASSSRLGN